MKKNNGKIIVISIFLILIVISFIISLFNDIKYNNKIDTLKEEVLRYLNDKYNEQFKIVDFSYVKNTYNAYEDDELVTKEMTSSFVYTLKMESARLIEFDVMYVVYEDKDEYIKYKDYDIMNEGIYENYIYEYKIRDIKREIKDDIYETIKNSNSLDIYINYFKEDSLLVDYSLDDNETKTLYDQYRSLDKTISNREWFDHCLEVNDNYSLVLDININNHINKDKLASFKDEVRNLVLYLEDLGYYNYDINFTFKEYVTGRVTPYLVDDNEQIYLIFEYKEYYTDIEEKDKLTAYIIDK